MAWNLGAKIGHTSVYKFYVNGICMSAAMKIMMMRNFEIMSNKFSVDDDCDDDHNDDDDDDDDDDDL
jgi:hypothetical protein